VESDYERHCRLARALAEEYFDPVASWGVCSSRPWPSVWAIQRSDMNLAIDHTTKLRHALERSGEPGATELLEALQTLLGAPRPTGRRSP